MLTEKCYDKFEEWYCQREDIIDVSIYAGDRNIGIDNMMAFNALTFSMQFGVYVDFFDSVGLILQMDYGEERFDDSGKLFYESAINDIKNKVKRHGSGKWWASGCLGSRCEAQTKAIERANELYNDTNKR